MEQLNYHSCIPSGPEPLTDGNFQDLTSCLFSFKQFTGYVKLHLLIHVIQIPLLITYISLHIDLSKYAPIVKQRQINKDILLEAGL